ncbi:adenosylcobinamide-phosphate synthase CbiB [Virgibacillus sp. YIM 98842]|uniref:adenosylcobinamide-phosphate synthase CbiB n=1 Tax=Virgibacillus sp. YIM 98842 TaxID=2663533 RepID=UPI0013DCEE1A|nr:adenosylcobinamide-phosphate synthase CbiB [Virgibacillus sp. YIM 98842]
MVFYHLISIILAVVIDRMIGDPPNFPHPVKGFGKMIAYFDKKWNRGHQKKLKGFFMLMILIVIILTLSIGIVLIAYYIHPLLGIFTEAILISTTIAQRGLREAALEVEKPLEQGDIVKARQKLSNIVGRDTENLSQEEIVRGTVETVAENTSDGITAPLFWAAIGGAPLALTYRLINTCDSMVGYKNDVYQDFGWASARMDDVVNWLPSRLTGVIMMLCSRAKEVSCKKAWTILFRDAKKHPSPNSGWGEAAVAALLGVRLGGVNYYKGKKSYRVEMGEPVHRLQLRHITDSINIMQRTVILFLLALILGRVIIETAIAWI